MNRFLPCLSLEEVVVRAVVTTKVNANIHKFLHLSLRLFFALIFFSASSLILAQPTSSTVQPQREVLSASAPAAITVITIGYYNPLTGKNQHAFNHNLKTISALNNEDLEYLAINMQDKHSTSLRLLNNQWLTQHSSQYGFKNNGRAVSKILQMGLRTYWNQVREAHYKNNTVIPDGDGKGSFGLMEYDLDVDSDGLEIGFTYQF